MAAMLDAATTTKTKSKPAVEDLLPVGVGPVFEAIRDTGKVLCEPRDKRWFGRLGALLKSVRIDGPTLDVLCAWLSAGGVNWWSTPPTFDHALANLPKWVNYALEWDVRGRQALGAKGGVGADVESVRPVQWTR